MKYRVDLKNYMSQCEANYLRLCKLLPDRGEADLFSLRLPGHGETLFHIHTLERTPYTLLLELRQGNEESASRWIQMPALKVRLYHDAQLAEVVAFEGVRRVWPRHRYPNRRMHQPDEKAQWSQFLEDWLSQAIRHGYAAVVPCEFGAL